MDSNYPETLLIYCINGEKYLLVLKNFAILLLQQRQCLEKIILFKMDRLLCGYSKVFNRVISYYVQFMIITVLWWYPMWCLALGLYKVQGLSWRFPRLCYIKGWHITDCKKFLSDELVFVIWMLCRECKVWSTETAVLLKLNQVYKIKIILFQYWFCIFKTKIIQCH